jgi:hypothetical protein
MQKLRTVPLHLGSDGLTIVQPHIQATTEIAKQQGVIVAKIDPAFRDFAQAIVDAINARIPEGRGRTILPEEMG